MKKIIISLVACGCFILSANAQDHSEQDRMDSKNNFHHQREMMVKQLDLSPDQRKQLKVNHENFKIQMAALDQNESISVKEYRDKKYALRKEQKAQFMNVLTPDQINKFVQIKKDMQAKREMMASKKIEEMKTALNLSDEQAAAIKANRQALRNKIYAIIQNDSLSRVEKKEQLMAVKEANKGSIKTILTPDQLNKWKDLKKQQMEKRESGISQ